MTDMPAPEESSVTFTLTKADIRAFADVALRRQLAKKWALTRVLVTLLVRRLHRWRSVSLSRKLGAFGGEAFIRISREGVFTRRPGHADGLRAWRSLYSVETTDRLILFFVAPTLAVLVPRSAFASPEEATRFFERAKAWFDARHATLDVATELAPDPDALEVSYILTSEHVAASVDLLRRRAHRVLFVALVLVCAALECAILPYAVRAAAPIARGDLRDFSGLLAVLFAFLGLPLWAVLVPMLVPRKTRQLALEIARRTGSLDRVHVVRISPRGVFTRVPGIGEGQREWSALHAIRDDAHHIALYLNPKQAVVIPKAAFASAEEGARFLAQARSWLDAARRAKKDE